MVIIHNFIASLKCTWIIKLTQCHKPWMDIFKEINGNDFQKDLSILVIFIYYTRFRETTYFGKMSLFLLYVLWKKLNHRLCNTKHIFNIPVWYNTGIKIGEKHVFIETLYSNGVTTFGDFLNENGIILSRKDFMQRFHLFHIPPMRYNSIISANSTYMSFLSIDRSSLNRDCNPFMSINFEFILLKDKIHILYKCLTSNDCIPSAINKWNNELSNV